MAAQPSYLEFAVARRTSDVQDLSDLICCLHAGSLKDERPWTEFEALLCTKLHCKSAIFSVRYLAPSLEHTSATVHLGMRHANQHYDPVVRLRCDAWLEDKGNPQLIALDVRADESTLATLRLARAHEHGSLTAFERNCLRDLTPHIRIAAGAFRRVQRLKADHSLLAEQLLPAVILVDASGVVVQISESARMLLRQEKSIAVENGRIRVSCSQGAAAFRERLKKGTCALRDGRTSGVDAMQLRRTSNNTPLWLVLRPLSGDQRPENSRIAVILHCHNDEPDVPLEALQHLFGLTRAEAAVALRLARGKTVKEVTEELGVSLSTTRTHLRSIFDKTCIDKQTKLVRTVLRGISMLSCR